MDGIDQLLSKVATSRRISRGIILLSQGDEPNNVFVIQSGCVKVYRVTPSNEEQVAGFKTAGDIFPEGWVFGHVTNIMYCYETVEDCRLLTIDRQKFLEILNDHPDYKQRFFDYMAKNYSGLMIQLAALEHSYARDKILMMLYYMMVRHSVEKNPDEHWLLMKLSHETIAGLTGLTRKTVTTELGRLKRHGVVVYDTKKFIIYKSALRDKLGEEIFNQIQLG